MIDRRGLVDGGAPINVTLTPAQEAEFARTSTDLRRRFSLDVDPFRHDREAGKLWAVGISGILRVGHHILEIKPGFLSREPRWRLEFLRGVARLESLDWEPKVKASHDHRSLADIIGVVIDHSLLRAINDGVPRTYSEQLVVGTSVRGQFAPAHAWRRAIDPGAIACRVSRLDQDNSLLSLLKWAARELAALVEINWLRNELERFEFVWPEAQAVLPPMTTVESMVVPPQFGFLDDGVAVATLVSRTPHIGLGDASGQALVWRSSDIERHYLRNLELRGEEPPAAPVPHPSTP